MNKTSDALIAVRNLAGLNQDFVAEWLGLSRPTYISLEYGKRPPTWPEMVGMASLFRMGPELLAKHDILGLCQVTLQHQLQIAEQAFESLPSGVLPSVSEAISVPHMASSLEEQLPDLKDARQFDSLRCLFNTPGILVRFPSPMSAQSHIHIVGEKALVLIDIQSGSRAPWLAAQALAKIALRQRKGADVNTQDRLADSLANELMMPAGLVLEALNQKGSRIPLEQIVYQLAQRFGVPYLTMLVRLNQLEVISAKQYETLRAVKHEKPSTIDVTFRPALVEWLVKEGRLPADWGQDFSERGPDYLQIIQTATLARYVEETPLVYRTHSVHTLHEETARWVGKNYPFPT